MSNLEELNYAIISDLRDQLEAKEQMIKNLTKKLSRAEWWLHEIVENHRFTPISTAEMALKELTESIYE